MLRTWVVAVPWLTKSASAISRLERPSASSRTTSSSQGDRPRRGGVRWGSGLRRGVGSLGQGGLRLGEGVLRRQRPARGPGGG